MAGEDIEVYSPQSPLGEAINGAQQGRDRHLHRAERQADLEVEIVDAVPYTG